MSLVSLIVPCYNEEPVLGLFYAEAVRVMAELPDYRFELIFVNDGSRDGTLRCLRELAEKDERVRYLSFSRNFGKEAAMNAGLAASQGDFVALLDADLQDPPALLPEMLRILREEPDMDCVATRRVSRRGEPPVRTFFARAFYHVIRRMTKLDIVDGARDFRLMRRTMTDAILSLPEYHRFSKGLFAWVGFQTHWIAYENIERAAGTTKWSFWKLLLYAFEGILAFTTIPLRFATFSGFFVSVCSFVYFLYILLRTIIFGIELPGYASTLVIILFLGGIQLTSIGVLGEYLAKNYMESKHRPLYIVRESNLAQTPDDASSKQ